MIVLAALLEVCVFMVKTVCRIGLALHTCQLIESGSELEFCQHEYPGADSLGLHECHVTMRDVANSSR